MNEEELLALVEKYQSRFGHRIPSWAGKNGTAEKIATAIASGEPVVEWRDYRPNPQNFFALAAALRREVAVEMQLHTSGNRKASRTPKTMPVKDTPSQWIGKPFSAIFCHSKTFEPMTWRIRHSGVQGPPHESPETHAVISACKALGITVTYRNSGSAANADSYHVAAAFLDGGLLGKTGNYWFEERGVWIKGRKAVLLVALQLGLALRKVWYLEQHLVGATISELKDELGNTDEAQPSAPADALASASLRQERG